MTGPVPQARRGNSIENELVFAGWIVDAKFARAGRKTDRSRMFSGRPFKDLYMYGPWELQVSRSLLGGGMGRY